MMESAQQPGWFNRAYLRFVSPVVERRSHQGIAERVNRYPQLESFSLEENRSHQWQALLKLLNHAYDSSPFYRRRFDSAGIRLEEIQSPADLARIPPLTRDDIRNNLNDLCSQNYRSEELLRAATGGTTDTPVPIARSLHSVQEKVAVHLCFNGWAGYHPGDKVFMVWGARSDYSQNPTLRWRLFDRLVMRRIWAPTSLFNEQILESYRLSLNDFRPKVLYGYPSPISMFCEYLQSSRRPFHRPATVITIAEPLLAHQRKVIEQTVGCKVFEMYGTREFGVIAAECELHVGMHVNPAAAYVEFLPVKGAEVDGLHEILVTDLLNDGMPLIRYRINDCTLLGPQTCACGRGYPMIRQITGRTMDVFYLPNGDVVPGISLQNRVIQVCPGLKKMQVIQDTLEEFRVRFVPGPEFSRNDIDLLLGNLKKFFPDDVRWKLEQVSEIERERNGKTRFCISYVKSPAVHVNGILQRPGLETGYEGRP